jgi:hypothetical protein
MRTKWFTCAMVLACATTAMGQISTEDGPAEFSLGIGYANVSLGSSSAIDGESALRFEPSLTFSPIQQVPQLRFGADVGVSMVLDNSNRTIVSNDGQLIFFGSSDIPLWTLEPELRLSWRQALDPDHRFFIEPGVAGGALFGFLDLNSPDNIDSYDANASTVYGRVFLRAGARVTGGIAGFEASWMSGGNLDFGGNASGDVSEWYVGFFGAIQF